MLTVDSNLMAYSLILKFVSYSQADVENREYMYCYRFRGPHIYLAISYFCHFNYIIAILLCPKDVEAVGLPYQPKMLLK